MKVKYALTLALSHHASLLLLDEPTSGLDPDSRDELMDIFLDLVAREGVTILFSTHIITDLERSADRILYLCLGRLIADRPVDALRDTPLEQAKEIRKDQSWLDDLAGKAVKMVSMLLFDLPY